WRIAAETNPYTRKRLIILVTMVSAFWWLVPWLTPFYEPYVGFLWAQPVFPSLHVPGTITFFLILALVFLFGRRIICGFNCPCVGIRETVGFAFRDRTPRSQWTWRLRHSKWFFFIYYVGVMLVTQFPPNSWTVSFVGGFYVIVALTYFGTFFIAPLVGNRFYCRYLCPYGATFGLLNHAGFYGINMDKDKCIDCQRCEQVCDMGIPVWNQGKATGRVTAIEDCMGCARCVVSCPTDALAITDVRNLFNKSLVQNASHLLKRTPLDDIERATPSNREADTRRHDWQEITIQPTLAHIQAQANRCLDCGMPGCINACPLNNRIPEWLDALAQGNIEQAADIAHSTSNFPEICGSLCPQHRLCEGACTKANTKEGAVTIGAAERFLTTAALDGGWQPAAVARKHHYNDRKIGIIGAGPAGLACADQLSKQGCSVTVYDKQLVIGGLLATGVPPFKLDKSMLERRQTQLEQQGVVFKLGVTVDQTVFTTLLADSDAIFMGNGSQHARDLRLPGQTLDGVTHALDYLQQINKNPQSESLGGKHVVVLGGGDTAMDCARSAIRQGANKVSLVYRGSEQAMCASPKEVKASRDEGVNFLFEHTPREINGDSKVSSIRFDNASNETIMLECDRIIIAVGQVNQPPAWLSQFVDTDASGRIVVDDQGRCSHEKIYAGGDNTLGPALVVTAIAAGRRAADAILKSFQPGYKLIQTVKRWPTTIQHNDTQVQAAHKDAS
ncbi:MAG: FAD-dependent oxidoreductase, partial [Proteobacteria bacterium]|nr:FAD-dependent oxidoreductase [Pseudomonadota bacterium]